jgi:hypothetical protein
MNDPERLLGQGASEHERRLLAAGAAEEPPADGAQRLALALGLGTTPMIDGAAEPSAANVATNGAPQSAAKWLSTKWLAIGGVSVVLVTGGALLATKQEPRPTPRADRAELSQRAAPPASSETPQATAGSSASPAPGTLSIADEIALLDEVRAALRAQAHRDALRSLGRYEARFPSGALAEEARFMEVEALAVDEPGSAKQRAAHFLRTYPNSVHGARVRTIVKALDGK